MADDLISVETSGEGYAVLTLNRPQAMNALSLAMCRSFTDAVAALEKDPLVRVLIVTGAGRELPCGEAGEVWLRGPMVVKGYWDNPAATAANITGGFWHSGDIGSLDRDGYLSVLDRRKDMLNRGGYKIYSVEVENVLVAHPAVIEAAVVGKPCPVLGERVHVFVSTASAVSERELALFCAQRLADYKVPESFTIQSEALPRNPNGKLLKRELRDRIVPPVA